MVILLYIVYVLILVLTYGCTVCFTCTNVCGDGLNVVSGFLYGSFQSKLNFIASNKNILISTNTRKSYEYL